MQQRVATRRRQSGRWMGEAAASASGQPPRKQRQLGYLAAGQADGADLELFARGGLERKVARFAETLNSLRHLQQQHGADVRWGLQDFGQKADGGGQPSDRRPSGDTQPDNGQAHGAGSWEHELGVTRVRRAADRARRVAGAGTPPRAARQEVQALLRWRSGALEHEWQLLELGREAPLPLRSRAGAIDDDLDW